MIIAFLVSNREPSYIHQTLASMHLSDTRAAELDVRLHLDADDESFLKAYAHNKKPKVILAPKEHRAVAHNLNRITLGLARSLADAPEEEHFIFAEDDIVFLDGWVSILEHAAKFTSGLTQGSFLLSGYSPKLLAGGPIARVSSGRFYGNQLLYVPKRVRAELARYLLEHVGELPADLLIARWSVETQVSIFATVPSIAQHVGKNTSAGSFWHYSPMWPNDLWK